MRLFAASCCQLLIFIRRCLLFLAAICDMWKLMSQGCHLLLSAALLLAIVLQPLAICSYLLLFDAVCFGLLLVAGIFCCQLLLFVNILLLVAAIFIYVYVCLHMHIDA